MEILVWSLYLICTMAMSEKRTGENESHVTAREREREREREEGCLRV